MESSFKMELSKLPISNSTTNIRTFTIINNQVFTMMAYG